MTKLAEKNHSAESDPIVWQYKQVTLFLRLSWMTLVISLWSPQSVFLIQRITMTAEKKCLRGRK